MRCPYCNSENSKTLETRDSPENTTRRRRECINCGKRFTTYEYVETVELMVRKKDGELERFDVNKIIRGLQKACEKRPVTMSQINELAGKVRQDLMLKDTEEVASQRNRRFNHEVPEKCRSHCIHSVCFSLQAV